MNSKYVFVMVGALALGLWSPLAMAGDDTTNSYFSTPMNLTTLEPVVIEKTTSSPVLIETTTSSPVVIEKTISSPVVIEKTISSPVLLEKTSSPAVLIEDRIIKQKHFFGIGIWPLFDFEIE
jgi:hypothetical protein